jgi:diguanylate cyclase (GGDEF)-like protein
MEQDIALVTQVYRGSPEPCSFIMVDLDNFKSINDRYGHETGDQVLIQVAEVMQACLRKQDLFSRWGGEEFLILLPGACRNEAETVASRVCSKVASTRFRVGEAENHVTVTCGVSTLDRGSPAADSIRQADMALYEGKRLGKNCVVVA